MYEKHLNSLNKLEMYIINWLFSIIKFWKNINLLI